MMQIVLHFQCNVYENGSTINIRADMVTTSVVVRVVERVVAVVANCAAVLKHAPFAVTVAAMVSLEHCTELDPEETNEYIRKPLPAGLQVGPS